MVRKAYYEDSYLRHLSAIVTSVDGEWVELDQTIFYPLGGGQPGDTGIMKGPGGREYRVLDTRKSDASDQIRHQLDTDDHGLQPGDPVDTEIDWERRF